MIIEAELGIKLILSFIFGAIIGFERELSGHPAGLRTMILVCLGSTSFVLLGVHGIEDPDGVSRVIQGVATGIGFLGAGSIVKEGFNVKGLTTAASIWVMASIGGALALGQYKLAGIALFMTIMALSVIALMERWIDLKPREAVLIARSKGPMDVHSRIFDLLISQRVKIDSIRSERGSGGRVMIYEIILPRTIKRDRVLGSLEGLEGLQEYQLLEHGSSGDRSYSR